MDWSEETVDRALELRVACGDQGYTELIEQGYPFPSMKTLQTRMLGEETTEQMLDLWFVND